MPKKTPLVNMNKVNIHKIHTNTIHANGTWKTEDKHRRWKYYFPVHLLVVRFNPNVYENFYNLSFFIFNIVA